MSSSVGSMGPGGTTANAASTSAASDEGKADRSRRIVRSSSIVCTDPASAAYATSTTGLGKRAPECQAAGALDSPRSVYKRPGPRGDDLLVQGRLLEAIDDDDLHRPAGALQLQAQLLLYRREEVRAVRIRGRRRWGGRFSGRPDGHFASRLRRPLQREVEVAGQSGLVDDRPAHRLRQELGDPRHRHTVESDHAAGIDAH